MKNSCSPSKRIASVIVNNQVIFSIWKQDDGYSLHITRSEIGPMHSYHFQSEKDLREALVQRLKIEVSLLRIGNGSALSVAQKIADALNSGKSSTRIEV